jgi:hypothetical protein
MIVPPIGARAGLAADQVEILRKRVRHAQWRGRRLSPDEVFVRHYRFQPELMPGFSLRRVRKLPLADGSILVQATVTEDLDPARMLRIEAYEMPSVEAAQDRLVELLGSFELPVADLPPVASGLGDVEFRVGRGAAMVFTRGNIAFAVVNAATGGPSDDLARSIDAAVLDKPDNAPPGPLTVHLDAEGSADVVTEAASAAAPRRRAAFLAAAPATAAAAGDVPMIKIFSAGSRLERTGGDNFSFRDSVAPSDIEAFAIDADGQATRVNVAETAGAPPPTASPPPTSSEAPSSNKRSSRSRRPG